MKPPIVLLTALLLTALILLGGCNSSSSGSSAACAPGPYFDHLPVNQEAIESMIVLGQFNPPGDVAPRPQTGVRFEPDAITPVYAVGSIRIVAVEQTTWLESPTREGHTDYSLAFEVEDCRRIRGIYGHIEVLSVDLDSALINPNCEVYSTESETVEACYTQVNITRHSGDILGEAINSLDFDLYDTGHTNVFYSPQRLHSGFRTAICPQPLFTPALETFLLDKVGRGGVWRTAEPVCGTMEIDVPGTAQGLWVLDGHDVVLSGETYDLFFSLALDDLMPETYVVLVTAHESFSIEGQGSVVLPFAIQADGRVNRSFVDLPADNSIYCYSLATDTPMHHANADMSVFVALGTDGKVTLERRDHAFAESPCTLQSPDDWQFSADALRLMR
jgi:hypothetical protein